MATCNLIIASDAAALTLLGQLSWHPAMLIKPVGLLALIGLCATVGLAVCRRWGRPATMLKIHKLSGLTTLAAALAHGLLVMLLN